jgi:hypothetical protein
VVPEIAGTVWKEQQGRRPVQQAGQVHGVLRLMDREADFRNMHRNIFFKVVPGPGIFGSPSTGAPGGFVEVDGRPAQGRQ